MNLQTPLGFAVFWSLFACGEKYDTTDEEIDAETDTDFDADSETDYDTVPDTDSDTVSDTGYSIDTGLARLVHDDVDLYNLLASAEWTVVAAATVSTSSITGTLDYTVDVDGTIVCDTEISFTGTPYSGDCNDCDFAFVVETAIDSERGTKDCDYVPHLSLIDDKLVDDFIVSWDDVYYETRTWWPSTHPRTYAYYDALNIGRLPYGGISPSWYPLHFEGPYHETHHSDASYVKGILAWEYHYLYEDIELTSYYSPCTGPSQSTAINSFGVPAGTGAISCAYDHESVDVWEVDLVRGDWLKVSVDTRSEDTAFDAQMWVNGPSGCTVMVADDNFRCTFGYAYLECPSAMLFAEESGTFEIVIANSFRGWAGCNTGIGEYELLIE